MTFATPQHPRWELQFLINFGVIWGRLFCDIFKRWFQQPDFVMLISSFGQFSCPLISLTSGWVDRSHIQEIICRKPLETSRDWILQAPGQSLGDQKCRCITVNGKTSSGNFKMVDCFILFCSSSLRWPIPVIQTIMLLIQTICLELQDIWFQRQNPFKSSKLGWFDLHFSHIVPLIWKSRPHFPSTQCQLLWSLKAGKLLACCLLLHQAGGYEGCWVTAPFPSISP